MLHNGAVCSQWDLVRDQRLNHRPEVVSEVLTAETDTLITDYRKPNTPSLSNGALT